VLHNKPFLSELSGRSQKFAFLDPSNDHPDTDKDLRFVVTGFEFLIQLINQTKKKQKMQNVIIRSKVVNFNNCK